MNAAIAAALGILCSAAHGSPCSGYCGPYTIVVPVLPKNGADTLVGELPLNVCKSRCPNENTVVSCRGFLLDGGTNALECSYQLQCGGSGRRPAGLVVRSLERGARAYLARCAALEAASVDAFRILGRELRAHGAPAELIRACERAARDEMRHARAMSRLANRSGARACRVSKMPPRARSLARIARENVLEGCVGESWGALLAHVQAMRAHDPTLRAVMGRIAIDEARHAALSLAIDAWIRTRMSARAQKSLDRARRSRITRLTRHAGPHELGLPTNAEAHKMAGTLFGMLA